MARLIPAVQWLGWSVAGFTNQGGHDGKPQIVGMFGPSDPGVTISILDAGRDRGTDTVDLYH
jgi:hypothetical protein